MNALPGRGARVVLVTGGLGFIGSCLVRHLIRNSDDTVINLDKCTYAANPAGVAEVEDSSRYTFVKGDICDRELVERVLVEHLPDTLIHLAAESHVDRSIDDASAFIQTNVVGTFTLLEAALRHWYRLGAAARATFRFHHVSTDEVYGSLGATGKFVETTPYSPNSPYSASKAGSDHLVRAWHATFGLPAVMTNCSNNYGPFQFPEKLIPLTITKALAGESLPVYGDGSNVRDWLYVEDHAVAIDLVSRAGVPGETYNIGGDAEVTNLTVVNRICDLVDELAGPLADGRARRELITFVRDRPGHDRRYAIDFSKLTQSLGWVPRASFDTGLRQTVTWYLENQAWWQEIRARSYAGHRLGSA